MPAAPGALKLVFAMTAALNGVFGCAMISIVRVAWGCVSAAPVNRSYLKLNLRSELLCRALGSVSVSMLTRDIPASGAYPVERMRYHLVPLTFMDAGVSTCTVAQS